MPMRCTVQTCFAFTIAAILAVNLFVMLQTPRRTSIEQTRTAETNNNRNTGIELAIGIITVSRENDENYLLQTLDILKSVIVLHPRSQHTPTKYFNKRKTNINKILALHLFTKMFEIEPCLMCKGQFG
jgi:hypothetical protein